MTERHHLTSSDLYITRPKEGQFRNLALYYLCEYARSCGAIQAITEVRPAPRWISGCVIVTLNGNIISALKSVEFSPKFLGLNLPFVGV